MYVSLDQDGRIESTTENKEYAEPTAVEFSFPEDFDFRNQNEYCIKDRELVRDPLPVSEEELSLEKEAIRREQVQTAVVLLVQSSAKTLSDEQALSVPLLFEEWVVGKEYEKDYIVQYGDDIYRIGQDHTSQKQWKPGDEGTTALYSLIKIDESGYEEWKAFDGVSGIYALDQIVKDPSDGKLYKSKIASNVWGPPHLNPDFWELYEAEA